MERGGGWFVWRGGGVGERWWVDGCSVCGHFRVCKFVNFINSNPPQKDILKTLISEALRKSRNNISSHECSTHPSLHFCLFCSAHSLLDLYLKTGGLTIVGPKCLNKFRINN